MIDGSVIINIAYQEVLLTNTFLIKATDCFILVGSALYGATWLPGPGYTSRTTIIFGTMKDSSLKILVYY